MANHITILVSCLIFTFTNITLIFAQWSECNNGIFSKDAVWCFAINGNNTYTGISSGPLGISGSLFMTTNNGDSWTLKNKGLSKKRESAILSLAINGNNIFAGSIRLGVYLSTDEGENWVQKSNGLPYYANGDTSYIPDIFSLKFVGNNIFAGTNIGVYLSTDNGDNWIPRNNGLFQIDSFNSVYSITNIGHNIFAGARYGVYMTSDNGENWLVKNNGLGNIEVLSLEVNENIIYAGTYFGLFQSTDNGDNWKNIGFEDYNISTIIIRGNNIILCSYGGGVYLSTDNGVSWTPKNSGLPSLEVDLLIINGDYIFAGVDNYGIYRAKLSDLGITDVKEQEQKNEIKIEPNPASDEFRLKFHSPIETTVQLSIFDLLGNCVLSQALQSTEGTNEKNINCEKLPQGYYYVKININEFVQTFPLVFVE
ncbi:MAG: T9SS type A sorting domain-containing protein [Ignavibacteriae bacterium]|nr:T9SS type A sorting domain-containing protein [Ignavibacteriota bacterium]